MPAIDPKSRQLAENFNSAESREKYMKRLEATLAETKAKIAAESRGEAGETNRKRKSKEISVPQSVYNKPHGRSSSKAPLASMSVEAKKVSGKKKRKSKDSRKAGGAADYNTIDPEARGHMNIDIGPDGKFGTIEPYSTGDFRDGRAARY